MGYTHYFERKGADAPVDPSIWGRFVELALRVVGHETVRGVALAVTTGPDYLSLNGVEDEEHEDLFLRRERGAWSFCKTAEKPYDRAVVTVLALAERTLPGFSWSSDGGAEAIAQARAWADLVDPK